MGDIRVATFDGPGAEPVIRTVPRPKVGLKAALILSGTFPAMKSVLTLSHST